VTRTVPIVFVEVIDPVGAGFVTSLARPGGNATGFSLFEFGISGKWLELLKQISPGITKAVVIRQPSSPGGGGQLGAIQAVAPSFGVEVTPVGLRDPGEIERAVAVADDANGGLIVTVSPLATVHRDLIVSLAARYRVPAVYRFAISRPAAALSPTGRIGSNPIDVLQATSIVFSKAKSPPICRCRRRPNTNSSSTSRPLRRLVSISRRHCSPTLTR
jgi:putative ABC transport system substrate-binding protein